MECSVGTHCQRKNKILPIVHRFPTIDPIIGEYVPYPLQGNNMPMPSRPDETVSQQGNG